jgi:hypothetical protein
MPIARELVTQQLTTTNAVPLSCTNCAWGIMFQPVSGHATCEELDKAFEEHNCKGFPRCDAPGCRIQATAGFQPFLDAGFSENPAAKILGNETWWCSQHKSLGDQFHGVSGNPLTPSH